MITLKFLGHSCFLLEDGQYALLFDPFMKGNPQCDVSPEEVPCTHLLISHGHDDHYGDAAAIAARTGALTIATAEIAGRMQADGGRSHAMHIGGQHGFDFGRVRITPAFHGAGVPGGHACGFVVEIGGITVYFAGDTSLFSDMELIGRLESIDYALLPIGDNFTMGPSDAVEAARMINAKTIIPMHYNTWPVLAQSPEAYKAAVEERTTSKVRIMQPGTALKLKV